MISFLLQEEGEYDFFHATEFGEQQIFPGWKFLKKVNYENVVQSEGILELFMGVEIK